MKNKNFYKIGLIYFTAMCGVALLFVLGYLGVFKSDFLSTFLIQVVVMFAIPLTMYTFLISKNVKKSFADIGFKKITFNTIVFAIALGIVLYFLNSFVANAFSSFITLMGFENLPSSGTVELNYELLLKEFILSCVFPGFFEEFLHRGILLLAGRKCGNTRYCLIISSILFGLMHLNINQFFYAAILGFLMGLVAIKSESIYPTMIIHFMNNFLNTYFFYGVYFKWPLAVFVNEIQLSLYNNLFVFMISTIIGISLLITMYIYLLKLIANERSKQKTKMLIKELQTSSLSMEEAQEKINQANNIIKQNNQINIRNLDHETKFSFKDNIFVICCYVLGGLVTILSFVWGII